MLQLEKIFKERLKGEYLDLLYIVYQRNAKSVAEGYLYLFVDKTIHTTNHNALSPNRVQQTNQSVRSAALK